MHSTASRSAWAVTALTVVMLAAAGCQTIGYYSHAALGQWRVLAGREPVTRLMERLRGRDDPAARRLHQQLAFSQQVLDFAEAELGLEVGRRYRGYVELERPAVVWNVFAAPPLSLTPHTWCYPIVGCAPYRGYFDHSLAGRRAAALASRGLETYIAPVPAYSTLGWFADPLLSSFINWPEADLAELLFHELAHGVVWVPGDVAFNESFATFVGRQAVSQWLQRQGAGDTVSERRRAAADRLRLLDLLERTRTALMAVYDGDAERERKLEDKARILRAVAVCYAANRSRLGDGRFDALMDGLDNARLVSVSTYEDLVPGFAAVFAAAQGGWPEFFTRVRALAELDEAARRAALGSGDEQIAETGDDRGAHQVECEALAGHFLDAEATGGVHDHVGRGGHWQHEGAGSAHGRGDHEQLRVHACAHGGRCQDGHEQRGGGGVAGGFREEGHRQADAQDDDEHVQRREPGERRADGLTQARLGEGLGDGDAGSEQDQHAPGNPRGGVPVQQPRALAVGDQEQGGDGEERHHVVL